MEVDGKELCSTDGKNVLCLTSRKQMNESCFMCWKFQNLSLIKSWLEQLIQMLLCSQWQTCKKKKSAKKVWIAFGPGKYFWYIAVHDIARQLRPLRAKALPVFQAITGCDTVYFFWWKRKNRVLGKRKFFPADTEAFLELAPASESFQWMHGNDWQCCNASL